MFPLLLLLYGLPGAAALVYQALWVRPLGASLGMKEQDARITALLGRASNISSRSPPTIPTST